MNHAGLAAQRIEGEKCEGPGLRRLTQSREADADLGGGAFRCVPCCVSQPAPVEVSIPRTLSSTERGAFVSRVQSLDRFGLGIT